MARRDKVMTGWKPIQNAPVGETIILLNELTGTVEPGYGEWIEGVPRPRWIALSMNGVGRFKATHFHELPEPFSKDGE